MCKTGPENDVDHTPVIRQHYVFLVDSLDAKHCGLVDELYQAEVLNNEERESISSEATSFTQNVKLLSMLSRKTKDQFDKFLDALNKTGQQHVRNHITGRQGPLLRSLSQLSVCLYVCMSLVSLSSAKTQDFCITYLHQLHKRGLCRHAVSVCVCLSVTFVNCVKTNKHIIKNVYHRVATPL